MNRKILSIVSLLLVFVMLFAFAGCSGTEEEETETTISKRTADLPTEQLTKVDEGDSKVYYVDAEGNTLTETTTLDDAGTLSKNTALLDYYNVNVNALVDGSTKAVVTRSEEKSISKQTDENGESVKMSDNAQVNAAIDALKKYMLVTAEDETSDYTSDLKSSLPGTDYVSSLTIDDVESSTCVDGDTTRTVVIVLKSPVPQAVIDENFDKEDINSVYAEFGKASDYMTVDKDKTHLEYTDCTIEIVTDLETDDVLSIRYTKGINVDTVITGKGKLESVGTLPVSFLYTYTVTYTIDRQNPAEAE